MKKKFFLAGSIAALVTVVVWAFRSLSSIPGRVADAINESESSRQA